MTKNTFKGFPKVNTFLILIWWMILDFIDKLVKLSVLWLLI